MDNFDKFERSLPIILSLLFSFLVLICFVLQYEYSNAKAHCQSLDGHISNVIPYNCFKDGKKI